MSLTKKEINALDEAGVNRRLTECRTELRSVRVKAAGQDLKNVRSIRELRRELARLLTRRHQLVKPAGNS